MCSRRCLRSEFGTDEDLAVAAAIVEMLSSPSIKPDKNSIVHPRSQLRQFHVLPSKTVEDAGLICSMPDALPPA